MREKREKRKREKGKKIEIPETFVDKQFSFQEIHHHKLSKLLDKDLEIVFLLTIV